MTFGLHTAKECLKTAETPMMQKAARIPSPGENGPPYTLDDLVKLLHSSWHRDNLADDKRPKALRTILRDIGVTVLTALLVFAIGVSGFGVIKLLAGDDGLMQSVTSFFQYAYTKIGVTAYALIPMAAFLICVVLVVLAERFGWFRFKKDPRRFLKGIAEFAPLFGVLGTMIGLVEVMGSSTFGGGQSASFQSAVASMSSGIGTALVSSVVGLTLAIFSAAACFVVAPHWKEERDE